MPFAVLARPRLWPFVWWQLSEIIYFLAIWSHLVYYIATDDYQITGYPGINEDWYFSALVIRSVGLLVLAAYVVQDIPPS